MVRNDFKLQLSLRDVEVTEALPVVPETFQGD